MPSLPGFGSSGAEAYGAPDPNTVQPSAGERGYRRKKLAAMAGNVYKAGATAVNEIKEGYAHMPKAGEESPEYARTTIPGSFPDVAIKVQGNDQMVIFPSYAKRHVKQDWNQMPQYQNGASQANIKDEEYWRRQWERDLDERAIVDVDVRGWIYSPHKGPMTRRNRILIGLARQLSGIPAPKADGSFSSSAVSGGQPSVIPGYEAREERREMEQVARKAFEIESKGQEEKRAAYRGEYSEASPADNFDDIISSGNNNYNNSRSRSRSPSSSRFSSAPGSPKMTAKEYNSASELTEAELTVANANLMARIAPFMTTPLVQIPITLFFYNDSKSASRTVETNDAGHFIARAALEFVPTHVRVLANSDLSTTQEVKIIEPRGVSLISDIDDTIKRSNISGGAKEIFRNTFIRELQDLTISGVKDWYQRMHKMGVSIHYCSNSPWQLFPVLASYFMIAGLPQGSLHLKQYSGMLQGIFEPVAERKRSTLVRLMTDFPERRFLLVGDSGEADLEVYTELAQSHPGRVLAVFIRDVTTPEEPGYFNSSFEPGSYHRKSGSKASSIKSRKFSGDEGENRPSLPPRRDMPKTVGPAMGDLIDFSEEPAQAQNDHSAMLSQLNLNGPQSQPRRVASTNDLGGRQGTPPPPRPAKPPALRSTPSDEDKKSHKGASLETKPPVPNSRGMAPPPLPNKPRNHSAGERGQFSQHPLSQMQVSSPPAHKSSQPASSMMDLRRDTTSTTSSTSSNSKQPPAPPLPRRRGPNGAAATTGNPDRQAPPTGLQMPNQRPATSKTNRPSSLLNEEIDFDPLPPPTKTPPLYTTASGAIGAGARAASTVSPAGSPTLNAQNKKVELWKRRLARAHETLDKQGIRLYTWRRGDDVISEAVGIVEQATKSGSGWGVEDARKDGARFERELKREKEWSQQQQQHQQQGYRRGND